MQSSRDLHPPKPKSRSRRATIEVIDVTKPSSMRGMQGRGHSSRKIQQDIGHPNTPSIQSSRRLNTQYSGRHPGRGAQPGRGGGGGRTQRNQTGGPRSQRFHQQDSGGRGRGQKNPKRRMGRAITAGFRVGQRVRLLNLLTTSMNGKEGYVYEVTRERVHVTIRDQYGVDYVAIQAKNLKILAQPKKSKTKISRPDFGAIQRDIRQKKKKSVKEIKADTQAASKEAADDGSASAPVPKEETREYETEQERRDALKKFAKDLKARGLKPELLCEDADDAVSAITFSDQSYVMDLYLQKQNRERNHTQEVFDEARVIYEKSLKEGGEEDEAVFLSIFNKVMTEREPTFKEQDAIADKRLDKELDRLKKLYEKKKASTGEEDEDDDDETEDDSEEFVYDEEELYTEIGQYEPVVRIPDPSTTKVYPIRKPQHPQSPKSKKVSKVPAETETGGAVDTGCSCAIM